jgi:hypothetical protein
MYRDYAISPTLFSRDSKLDVFGSGAPYLFLGPARYVDHTGDRPIAITWRLDDAMPTDVFTTALDGSSPARRRGRP